MTVKEIRSENFESSFYYNNLEIILISILKI